MVLDVSVPLPGFAIKGPFRVIGAGFPAPGGMLHIPFIMPMMISITIPFPGIVVDGPLGKLAAAFPFPPGMFVEVFPGPGIPMIPGQNIDLTKIAPAMPAKA